MTKVNRIFIYISITIVVIIMLVFSIFMKNTEELFSYYYSKQLDNYSNILRKSFEMADAHTDIYDQLLTDDLYYRLASLNQDLKDTPLKSITDEMLELYKEKYDLLGVAIFMQDSEGILIHNSTIKEEIGNRTKEWGYWNEAFESLFKGKRPMVEKGMVYDNFWVGPRSSSYYMPDFYRYAYYYNENQDYLINGIIHDNNSYKDNIENLLNDVFVYLNEEVSYIESISLIDLDAWEKAYYNDYRNPEAPAFIYGNFDRNLLIHSNLSPEDLKSIEGNRSFTFNYNGNEEAIFLISVDKNDYKYMIAISIDDQDRYTFIQKAGSNFAILLVVTLGVVFIGIFYIVSKHRAALTFQMERNEEIERFTKNVAMLPEITYKCKIENSKLLLTYNYGKSISEDMQVSLKSSYRPMDEVYSARYVEDFKYHVEEVFQGKSKRFEIDYNGGHYEHFVSPILDENGKVTEIIGIATNITDRRIAEEESKYLATHDSLTGLKNRIAFEDYVKTKIGEHNDSLYAIMFLDLDGFKYVNDTFGHVAGDVILRQTAYRMKEIINPSAEALVARMGGDEFSIFSPYNNVQEIIDMAEGIINSVSQPYLIKEDRINLGISIGISLYNKDSSIYRELVYYADMAMYRAKKSGSSYKFFSEKMLIDEL